MSTPSISLARRREEAVRLRSVGATYATIAATLGVSISQAHRDVTTEVRRIPAEEAQHLRQIESMRLDALQRAVWGKALAGDLKAVDRALRIVELRCKLLGLNAPQQIEVGLDGVDFDARERELIAQIAESQRLLDAQALEAAAAEGAEGGG
jgi:hypothetical protein